VRYVCVVTVPGGGTVHEVVALDSGQPRHLGLVKSGEVLCIDEAPHHGGRVQLNPVYLAVDCPGFTLPHPAARRPTSESEVGYELRFKGDGQVYLELREAVLASSPNAARARPLVVPLQPRVPVLAWLWWSIVELPWVWLAGGAVALLLWVRGRRAVRARLLAADQAQAALRTQAAVEAVPAGIGDHLGGYRLVRELGQGGMGIVYLAERPGLGGAEQVAIKWMKAPAPPTDVATRRFAREGRVGEALCHPGIVAVHAQGEHGGRRYLVMDYVDGEPLDALISGEGLPLAVVRELVVQVVAALAHAHAQGVVHRDLKPSNILCARQGGFCITDFGLARRHDFSALTLSDTALGTPAYMPPEQITGEVATPAADQYALGVTLFEALCGRLPFDHDELALLLTRHLYAEPPAPSSVRTELPLALDAVLLRMLAKAPQDRYPSIQAAGEALVQALG
jgi:predicted Ser/Thr protein kinase